MSFTHGLGWTLALISLFACSRSKAPDESKSWSCPTLAENPDERVQQLTDWISNAGLAPEQRVEAVREVPCLLSASRRNITGKNSPVAAVAAGLTLGTSEVALAFFSRTSVVSEGLFKPAVKALHQAFCDPAPMVREAAVRVFEEYTFYVTGPGLQAALGCVAEARAIKTVGILEERAFDSAKKDKRIFGANSRPFVWSTPAKYASILKSMLQDSRPELNRRINAALTALEDAAFEEVAESVRSGHLESFKPDVEEFRIPLLETAWKRVVPLLRERMMNADYRERLAAARIVWQFEGFTASGTEALVASLWKGLSMPAPIDDPTAGERLKERVEAFRKADDDMGVSRRLAEALLELARTGPSARSALTQIRACISLRSEEVSEAAAVALAVVGKDRKMLPLLRKSIEFAGSRANMIAGAILYLEPNNRLARKALYLKAGLLLTELSQKSIEGDDQSVWLLKLILEEQAGNK